MLACTPRPGSARNPVPRAGAFAAATIVRANGCSARTWARLGVAGHDAVLPADPLEHHLRRAGPGEPAGELHAVVGEHPVRHAEPAQRLGERLADGPAGRPAHQRRHRCTACRETPNRSATSVTGTPAWTSNTARYRCSVMVNSTTSGSSTPRPACVWRS